jgi:hypothetical protein
VKRAIAIALMLALGSCGDDRRPPQSDAPEVPPDMPPDMMPPPPATLTTFVIGLIQNETLSNNAPRPLADFVDLPDPDGASNNLDAYDPLFP